MIVWDDSILTGLTAVDRDHKIIFEHIRQFIGHIEAQSNTLAIHDSFRKMERSIYQHLDTEENMLEVLDFNLTNEHKASHSKLIDDLGEIWDEMLASTDFLPDAAAKKWFENWLFIHVKNEDFLYRDWIVQAGLEEKAEQLVAASALNP